MPEKLQVIPNNSADFKADGSKNQMPIIVKISPVKTAEVTGKDEAPANFIHNYIPYILHEFLQSWNKKPL